MEIWNLKGKKNWKGENTNHAAIIDVPLRFWHVVASSHRSNLSRALKLCRGKVFVDVQNTSCTRNGKWVPPISIAVLNSHQPTRTMACVTPLVLTYNNENATTKRITSRTRTNIVNSNYFRDPTILMRTMLMPSTNVAVNFFIFIYF